LERRITVFAALLCYAKITPAALRRGEFGKTCREGAEAAVHNPKFDLSYSRRLNAGPAMSVAQAPLVAPA